MNELTKIARVIAKKIPDAPHEVLLVLDATAGQNGISQARGFAQAVKCTGIVLAKIDGTAKGGVIVPIRQQFGLPVKYVGVGEKAEDLCSLNLRPSSMPCLLALKTRTPSKLPFHGALSCFFRSFDLSETSSRGGPDSLTETESGIASPSWVVMPIT